MIAATGLPLVTQSAEAAITFVVNSTMDAVDANTADDLCSTAAGTCTLRAAIQQANVTTGAQVIELQAGARYPLTLSGSESGGAVDTVGDLDVLQAVTLNGNGATIDASADPSPWNGDRVLHVKFASGSAKISNVDITGGNSGTADGGGVYVESGKAVLDGVSIWGNLSLGAGGGLSVASATATKTVTVTSSTISNNISTNGAGGLQANGAAASINVAWSTVADNGTTQAAPAANGVSGTGLTLANTIVFNPANNRPDCSAEISNGYVVDRDGTCTDEVTDVTAAESQTDPLARYAGRMMHHPKIGSWVVDRVASCPSVVVDQLGSPRPSGAGCDIGAVEFNRKIEQLKLHVSQPFPDPAPDPADPLDTAEGMMNQLFAAYATGNDALGDSLVQQLSTFAVANNKPGPDWFFENGGRNGTFEFQMLLRLLTVDEPASWVANPSNSAKAIVSGWTKQFAQSGMCNFLNQWDRSGGAFGGKPASPWTSKGTENLGLTWRTQCLFALYLFQGDPAIDWASTRTWQDWAQMLTWYLQQSAVNGLFSEVQSPSYAAMSLSHVVTLRDFPEVTSSVDDDNLRRLSNNYLDLYWHDMAQAFNETSGVVTPVASRVGQWDYNDAAEPTRTKRGARYVYPELHPLRDWAYMYDWHDNTHDPVNETEGRILVAAASSYEPRPVSKVLAKAPIDMSYMARRTVRGHKQGTAYELLGKNQGLVEQVVSNSSYSMGALTAAFARDPAIATDQFPDHLHDGATLDLTFNVSFTSGVNDRVTVSGISDYKDLDDASDGGDKGTMSSLNSITGVAGNDVLLVGRPASAELPPPYCDRNRDGLVDVTSGPGGYTPLTWGDADPAHDVDTLEAMFPDGDSAHPTYPCTGNDRGIRIFLGQGPLRTQDLTDVGIVSDRVTAAGWIFASTPSGYAGIYVPVGATLRRGLGSGPDYSEIRLEHTKECHDPNGDGSVTDQNCPDIWTPIVIQLGRASEMSFAAFKTAVAPTVPLSLTGMKNASGSFVGPTGAPVASEVMAAKVAKVSYTSLAGTLYTWNGQRFLNDGNLGSATQPATAYYFDANVPVLSVPKVNGVAVNLNPSKTYSSPYSSPANLLSMTFPGLWTTGADYGTAPSAKLCAPAVSCVTLKFDLGFTPPAT